MPPDCHAGPAVRNREAERAATKRAGRERIRRGRRRLGAQRPRRRHRPRAARAVGAGARGAATTIGGGMRSAELTLPGFVHDVCSAIHPMASARRSSATLPLAEHGLELDPPAGPRWPTRSTTAPRRSWSAPSRRPRTAWRADAERYRAADRGRSPAPRTPCIGDVLRPARELRAIRCATARFGLRGAALGRGPGRRGGSRGERARALFAGWPRTRCCRSSSPIDRGGRAGPRADRRTPFGWPLARGGSQRIADALALVPARAGRRDRDRPPGRVACRAAAGTAVLFDLTPRQVLAHRRRRGCRPATGAGSRATATARASSSSTGRSTARSRGAPRAAAARPRSISAATLEEIAALRGRASGAAAHPERPVRAARPAEPVRPDAGARRQAHRAGPTATCRTAPRVT